MSIVRRGAAYLRLALTALGAARALRVESARASTLGEAIDLAERFRFRGVAITPWQVRPEIEGLLAAVEELAPRTVVEIGTAFGGTLFLFTRVAAPDALLVSIDLPGGRFGGSYPRPLAPLYRSFARERQRIELMQADSHAPGTLEHLERVLGSRRIDFLFIDGDHSYEGVKADFEAYARLVRPGGLVAFHDVVPGEEAAVGGVPRFWQELKAGREVGEFVRDWGQGGCGIGLVRVGDGGDGGQNGSSTTVPSPSA